MRLIVAVAIAAALIAGCGSDADRPAHRQAVDAFKGWADSFETAEYVTTALGVGERPTGEFEFQGEVRYRKDPESLWAILYLDGEAEASQDSGEDLQQLRVENEVYVLIAGVWHHAGSVDDDESIALENEVGSILGTPVFADRQVMERWLECAETSFGSTTLEEWKGQPVWIIRCRADAELEDDDAADLVKSVMGTLFGQAPGSAEELAEKIDAAQVGYVLSLQSIIHRESGALLLVDLAITLTDDGATSDIRWQTELVGYDRAIDFPEVESAAGG